MLLRPRQTEFVARVVAALRQRGNALAVAPTGFGKTVAMAAIIGRLLAGGGRALVLQHRQELVAQNIEKFRIINPAIPATVVDASAKDFEGQAVFGKDPREFQLLTKEFVVDGQGHIKAVRTVRVEWEKVGPRKYIKPRQIPGNSELSLEQPTTCPLFWGLAKGARLRA